MGILPRMLVFFCISTLLHLLFLFTLPDISRFFTINLLQKQLLPENRIEVELVKPVPRKMPPPVKERRDESRQRFDSLAQLADRRLQKVLPLGDLPVPAAKSIELPASRAPSPTTVDEVKIPPLPAAEAPDLVADFGTLRPGFLAGDERRPLAGVTGRQLQASEQRLLAALQEKTSGRPAAAGRPKSRVLGLEGPVARYRKVIFKPKLPEVSLRQATEIKLKFWVHPDGTVGRIEPLLIGDLSLVKTAEVYLQGWRFNTLSPDQPQRDQWGTITIRFTIK
ncbi:MAG: hypothetical protein JRJ56_03315 [Deltaproteobacteria bacterium]|nr:hypothetical protein [Deltaproteobacteria bacterium]